MRKLLLGLGLFITVLGIAAITEEVHGCLLCPLDGFFWYTGTTSEEVFGFLVGLRWHLIATGVATTLFAAFLHKLRKQPILQKKITIRIPRLRTWRKWRMLVHGIVYTFILGHITLATLGLTEWKSLCPRSLGELIMHGKLGTAAVFWIVVLLLVVVWGRGLCGWVCVFAPVQEQSVNLLRVFGFDAQKRKFRPRPIIWITTTMVWTAIAYYLIRNRHNLSFDLRQGQAVASYWTFVMGVITTIPLSVFFTYLFGSRWFCKYLCPIGGFQSLYSRFSLAKVKVDASKCTDCAACANRCQMGVNVAGYASSAASAIDDPNCIFCGDCIDACPKKALSFGIARRRDASESSGRVRLPVVSGGGVDAGLAAVRVDPRA